MIHIPFEKFTDKFLVMIKFDTNLWQFLSQKTCHDFDLVKRLNLAINLAKEVKKAFGVFLMCTAHKDLKPSNIMFDAKGKMCIIDAGRGVTYGGPKLGRKLEGSRLDWGANGTPGFLAPEQFAYKRQTAKVDIWALGKIIALIVFEWSFGWKLLWSPKFLMSHQIESLGPLRKLIDLLKEMIDVSCHYYINFILEIICVI